MCSFLAFFNRYFLCKKYFSAITKVKNVVNAQSVFDWPFEVPLWSFRVDILQNLKYLVSYYILRCFLKTFIPIIPKTISQKGIPWDIIRPIIQIFKSISCFDKKPHPPLLVPRWEKIRKRTKNASFHTEYFRINK